MTARPILTDGDPLLRQKSAEVDLLDPTLHDLIQDMLDSMLAADGIGLAAVQIGVLKRMIVVWHPNWQRPEVMINPRLISYSPELSDESPELVAPITEGCLSVPGARGIVDRWSVVKVSYTAPLVHWSKAESIYGGLASVIVQHELDHLDGILFTDKIRK